MEPVSLYLHIPFCIHRCSYCDFNTYSGLERLIPEYVDALCIEAEILSKTAPEVYPIGTIYLGGGTPSLLDASSIAQILECLSNHYDIEADVEITMEANPGTVGETYLKAVRGAGVNRLSIGMQSSNPFDLQFLERNHDFLDVIRAVKWARKAGFENISLDLIFGIPGQSVERWQNSLELAIGLGPDHLSMYALTIEDQTPLAKWMRNGLIEIPDADVAADMYEWASELLSRHGYYQYEISNWAKWNAAGEILSSRHNLQYWHNLPYIGMGAGAHGFIKGKRTVNILSPQGYIKRLKNAQGEKVQDASDHSDRSFPWSPAAVEIITVDSVTEMNETMIMGLRLVEEGVEKSNFFRRFGIPLVDIYGAEIEKLVKLGLLKWSDNNQRIMLSSKGRLLGNQVFMEFV